MSDYLEAYKQIATGHPDDSYEPGTGKQRIDLTEFYQETQQDDATVMVSGIESLRLGKFSKQVAARFKIAGYESYDPFPSERNARAGQEGFFTTIKEGFKTFIENIIKYIRMAVDWVVDTVKGIFGFRKSARITKAINDDLGKLKLEFVKTLNELGFPGKDYNLENFLMELPPDQDRIAQLTLLKSKFETDQESIDGLAEAMPVLQQTLAKITHCTDKVTRASKKLGASIAKEYTSLRVRAGNPALQTQATESPELNRITKEIQEVSLSLDVNEIATLVSKVYEVLYKVKFSNDELQTKFSECRKRVQDTVQTGSVQLRKQDVPMILASIQQLNLRAIEINASVAEISKIDFKGLASVVDIGEANKVAEIANFFNHPQISPALVQSYQLLTVDVRSFTQFCFSVTQSLLLVERQAANLVSWYNRAHAYYYHGLLGEVDKMAQLSLEARSEGHKGVGDADGYMYAVDRVLIKDADAKTIGEKTTAQLEVIIKSDFGGTKTALNNFSKQIGWGKML